MCKGSENAPLGSTLGTPALLHCSWFLQLLQSWNTGPAPTGPLCTPFLGLGTTKHRFSGSFFSGVSSWCFISLEGKTRQELWWLSRENLYPLRDGSGKHLVALLQRGLQRRQVA